MISRNRFKAGLRKALKRTRAAFKWRDTVLQRWPYHVQKKLGLSRKTSLPKLARAIHEMDYKLGIDKRGTLHRDRRRMPLDDEAA